MIGIYQIRNKTTDQAYIGSSKDINNRWRNHKQMLRLDQHHCIHLQRAWNKYAELNFIFEVIEVCNEENLLVREQHYLDVVEKKYNSSPIAGRSCPPTTEVFQYTLNGVLIKSYKSMFEAGKAIHPDNPQSARANISAVCRGVNDYYKSFHWSYEPKIFSQPIKRRVRTYVMTENRIKANRARCGKSAQGRRKALDQYTLDGVFIKGWSAAIEAAKFYQPDQPKKAMKLISQACTRTQYPTALGFKWVLKVNDNHLPERVCVTQGLRTE